MRFLILLLLFCCACNDARPRLDAGDIVLHDVTVIDGTDAPPRPHQTLVLRGRLIHAIDTMTAFNYGDADVLDVAGQYVLPGFIDMHAHVTVLPLGENGRLAARMDRAASAQTLRMLLAAGITTVRNPAAPTEDGVALREAVATGALVGPTILTAGAALNRTAPGFGPFVATPTPEAARAEVQKQAEAGVDFIKVYAALPPDVIAAAIDEAHRHGLPVIGHLQRTTWTEAATLGIDAITHGAPWSTAYLPAEHQPGYRGDFRGRVFWLNHIDLDGPALQALRDTLAAHRVVIDPTLIAYHTKFFTLTPQYQQHPDLRRVPAAIREVWMHSRMTDTWSRTDYDEAQAAWPRVLAFTKRLYDAGVPLTIGSDLPNPWVVPGASFHEEMQLLADAGIPTAAILQMATSQAADALGLTETTGRLRPGLEADLVVLQHNPLDSLAHTRSRTAVFSDGKRF